MLEYHQKELNAQEPDKEISKKHNSIKNLMERENLDAVLLKKSANFSWITAGALNVLSATSAQGVTDILILEGNKYVIANNIESPRMKMEEAVEAKGFELIVFPWHEEPSVLEVAREIAGENAKIGSDVELEGTKNIDSEISRARYQLMEPEIERYHWFGEKVSEAIEKVAVSLTPGVFEGEVAAELAKELWKRRIEPLGFQVGSDARAYNFRHPIATMKPVENLVMVNVIARCFGLTTTVTRTVHFGQPSEELKQQYRDNIKIEAKMIAETRPGRDATVPLERAVELYEELGYGDEWKNHHQGGSMGYSPRDYRVDFKNDEEILEDQAFCWNPSISGTKTEDGFIVTKEGPRFITYPKRFPEVEFEIDGQKIIRPDMMIL